MSEKTEASQKGDLITLEVAGRLLMIGPERVRQLIKAGYIERPKPGRTTIVSAVQGYIRFLKDREHDKTKTASASRAQEARAAEIELRIAERRRELIGQDEAALAMDFLVNKVREEMAGLAARVTRDLELRRTIEAEVHGAQTRIADALEEGRIFVAEGGDPPAAGAGDVA